MNSCKAFLFFLTVCMHASPQEDVKICLMLKVKNDEQFIWRCLSSAVDVADYVFVHDEGSSDRTISLIDQFLKETKIPGEIYRERPRDSFPFINSYFLHIEPHEKLEISHAFQKNALTEKAYCLGNSLEAKLIRADCEEGAIYLHSLSELKVSSNDFLEEGFSSLEALMLRKETPRWLKEQETKNLPFYVRPLPNTRFQSIALDLPLIDSESGELYRPMNPSILKTKEGYLVLCRTVNYTQTGGKIFLSLDSDGVIRTRNFLLFYDRDFHLLSQKEMHENLPREKTISYVEGLEDCRLFTFQGAHWFTCTTRDVHLRGVPQIALCKLGKDFSVESLVALEGPDIDRPEKNWMPFIKKGSLQLIYSYDPWIVYQPDRATLQSQNFDLREYTGKCSRFVHSDPPYDFSRFRGSAPPIAWEDGYLLLVHEVCPLENGFRVYLHRFLALDDSFSVTKISKPFTFQHQGVEFCCGMTLDHEGRELILSIGIEDREASFCFVDKETVQSLLHLL